jgi:hypothetical protein
MTDLHARYQRLLLAYPREYRRHRGAEIATTYTEMATEGQRWPRGRDAASLLRHGLRARLGRPRSRLVVPFTVLAMLVGGLCAAAAGARAGWGGSTGLSAQQIAEINQLAPTPRPRVIGIVDNWDATPTWLGDYLSMPEWGTSANVVQWNIDATTREPTPVPSGPTPRELVAEARARLAGSGWTVASQTITDTTAVMMLRSADLVARVGAFSDWVMYSYQRDSGQTTSGNGAACAYPYIPASDVSRPVPIPNSATCTGWVQRLSRSDGYVYRRTPVTVPVFAVAAGLLGAAMTYLLVGWVNRRAGRLAVWRRRMVSAGLALSAVLFAPAAAVCAAGAWTALRHDSDVPVRYWGGLVTGEIRIASLCAAVLLIATIAGAVLTRPALPAQPAAELAQ